MEPTPPELTPAERTKFGHERRSYDLARASLVVSIFALITSIVSPFISYYAIVTQRTNTDARGDIHDQLEDQIVRARLVKANGRATTKSSGAAARQAASTWRRCHWIC